MPLYNYIYPTFRRCPRIISSYIGLCQYCSHEILEMIIALCYPLRKRWFVSAFVPNNNTDPQIKRAIRWNSDYKQIFILFFIIFDFPTIFVHFPTPCMLHMLFTFFDGFQYHQWKMLRSNPSLQWESLEVTFVTKPSRRLSAP